MAENMYHFDLPPHHKSIIKLVGVGGGGSNAVNHMFGLGIKDVEFVVCNTDRQALESSPVPSKLQIGINLTSGLGAGANPEKGKNAAIESKEDIRELLSQDTKMVFITAGMGGGTGTGAAPVIAQVARELDILTVGIVTAPFSFEGKKKNKQAQEGIEELKKYCDTVIVIMNDKLSEVYGDLSLRDAFGQADNILTTAAKGIAEIITVPGYVNVDFEDVKTVMRNAGPAVMGSAKTSGENRARRAAEEALNSPLLNQQNIYGAEKVLLSIVSGEKAELRMNELREITNYIEESAGEDAEVIFGHGIDSTLDENVRVTVIATGFGNDIILPRKEVKSIKKEEKKIIEEKQPPQETVTIPLDEKKSESQDFIFDFTDTHKIEKKEEPKKEEPKEEMAPDLWTAHFKSITDEIKKEVEEEDKFSKQISFDFDTKENKQTEFSFIEESNPEDEISEFDLEESLDNSPTRESFQMKLARERQEREERLLGKKYEMETEEFKEKLDIPAYERKNVKLIKIQHSSEHSMSKYNLNEENQILGNNKFLHDNVD